MPVLFAPRLNRNTGSFTSSVTNRPVSPSQPANNITRFQPNIPSNASPKEARRAAEQFRNNRGLNPSPDYQSPQSQGGRIGERSRSYEPPSRDGTLQERAAEAERKADITKAKKASNLFEREAPENLTRRSRPNKFPSLPKPSFPSPPKTNFPIRLPRLRIPALPPGIGQLEPLFFPDALNEGEDEFLRNLARQKKVGEFPSERNDPVPQGFQNTRSGTFYYERRDPFNMARNKSKVFENQPKNPETFIQSAHVYDYISSVRSRFPDEEFVYETSELGYNSIDLISVAGISFNIHGSSVAQLFERFIFFVPDGSSVPSFDRDGVIDLPATGIDPGVSFAPPYPLEFLPNPVNPRKPGWRPKLKPGIPEQPFSPWDDPSRPPKMSPEPHDPPEVYVPRQPLPPFQQFLLPTRTSTSERNNDDEECKPGEDCMTCRFNPGVIQRIVDTAVNQAKQQIERNDDDNTHDIREDISGLRSRLDLLDLLQQILDLLQQAEGEDPENPNPDYISITVAVVEIKEDGTAEEKTREIRGHKDEVEQVKLKFRTLADMMLLVAPMSKNVRRTYRILGGNNWYQKQVQEDVDKPEYEWVTGLENKIKRSSYEFFDETGEAKDKNYKAFSMMDLFFDIATCVYYRSGYGDLPGEVPKNLLSFSDTEKPAKIINALDYQTWMVEQVDALVGQFPIEIEVKDIDPSKPGDQTKMIQLPNISEALAEMYGLALSGATNADLSINFLMRLAAETIATKNATLITQDYTKANAAFLGYKGNPARREIDYAFNPTKLDTLDQLLQNSKGYIQGWEEDDKESVVGFLQKIVFSAGLIKSVFFRDEKRLKELKKELESMLDGDKKLDDDQWKAFLEMINTGGSPFNQVQDNPKPKIDKQVNYKAPATGSTSSSTGGGLSGGASAGGSSKP